MAQESVRTWPLSFGGEPELELRADALAVSICPLRAGELPRLELSGRDAQDIRVDVKQKGDRVKVRLDRQHGFKWLGHWDASARLHLPPRVRAHIKTDAGTIDARDLGPCDLELETNAGRITAANLVGRVRLYTSAGQISADALAGSVEARSEAGAIQLGIAALSPGDHHVHAEVGTIRVDMAPGQDVRLETRSSIGSVNDSYPSNPQADTLLRLSTTVGAIKVRESDVRSPIPATGVAPAEPGSPPARAAETSATGEGVRRQGANAGPETETERILKMVESGDLSARDADELLQALERV